MSEITQAQFERVIERLADNNKALHDLVDFHAKENDRLREALQAILEDDEGDYDFIKFKVRKVLGEREE